MVSLTFSVLLAMALSAVRAFQIVVIERKSNPVKVIRRKYWVIVLFYLNFVFGMNYIVLMELGVIA